MSDINLGKLERVEVRKAWEHEAQHFTPWLADNLDLLGEELGIKLELKGEEVYVGPYRADIMAQNPDDGSIVLIENQLETADLKHLGQILAYTAGLDARTIVWVATDFNDIHRSAIRWLNEHTVAPFAFFAVQVSLVQIGDSQLAPVFEVLERPNEWERQVQDASQHGELSEVGRHRREFWAHFARRIPDAPGLRPGYAYSNIYYKVEESNIRISQYIAKERVGVYLIGDRGESMDVVAPRIEPYVKSIEKTVEKSDHYTYGDNYRCGINLYMDSHDRENWDKMVDWLDDRRRRYEEVLKTKPP